MRPQGPVPAGEIAGLVLAAGAGRRFGGPKQLAELGGRPLLEHALALVAAAPVAHRFVVLGSQAREIRERVDLHGATPVICEDWESGQARSLAAGIAAAGGASAALVLLGDQPLIAETAVARVIAAREPGKIAVRATYDGRPGHPVLLERELFSPALDLHGDAGARALFAGREDAVREVPCGDLGSDLDVDTEEALRELRRGF